jgi:hypothetical protein
LDQKPTAEIRSTAEAARAGGRALTSGAGSVSDRGDERTDRAGPAQERKWTATGVRGGPSHSIKIGLGRVRRGSKQVQAGLRGSKPFDQDRTGENQTGKDERLRVALTGGPGRQACVREAVSHGPGRSI